MHPLIKLYYRINESGLRVINIYFFNFFLKKGMVRVNPVYLFDITVACRVLFTEDMSALPTRDS